MEKTYTTTITKTFDLDEIVESWWAYSGHNKKYEEQVTFKEDLEGYYYNYGWDDDEMALIENNYKAFFDDLIPYAKEKGYIKKFSEEEK